MLPNGGPNSADVYANRTMLILIGVFAQAMSIAVFPAMARHTAAGAIASFRATTSKTLRIILSSRCQSSAFMFLLALPIIQMLYQRHNFHLDGRHDHCGCAPILLPEQIFAVRARRFNSRILRDATIFNTPVWTGRMMTGVLIVLDLLVVHARRARCCLRRLWGFHEGGKL